MGKVRPGGMDESEGGRVMYFGEGGEGVFTKSDQNWLCKFIFYEFFYYNFQVEDV